MLYLERLKASLHMVSDKSKVKNNLSAQCKDLVLKFFSMENSSKPWNRAKEFSEFEEDKGRRNDVMLLKEGRFGRQCVNASMYRYSEKCTRISTCGSQMSK